MKKLIWIILALITLEVLGIVGYNWVTAGYTGDATLTLSRYVGLNLWSSIAFGIVNLIIIVLMTLYAIHTQKLGSMILFLILDISYLILSICPHLPYESPITLMHQIFAITLFIVMLLIGITQYNKNTKPTRAITGLFVLYGLHFLFAYANHLPYFMNGILYWEIGYIYLFFISLLVTKKV